jgi:hypothetical protein
VDPAELRSTRSDTAWVCEVADTTRYADLAAFAEVLSKATIAWYGDQLEYSSTQGRIEFSWDGPLLVDGSAVSVEDYPRLDSPYGRVELGERLWSLTSTGVEFRIGVEE